MMTLPGTRKKLSSTSDMLSRKSLGFRLLMACIFIIVLVLTAYTIFSIVSEGRKAKKNLASKGQVLVDLLSYSSRIGVFAENREQLNDVAAGFVTEKDVMLVGIYNAEGKQLIVSNKSSSALDVSFDIGAVQSFQGAPGRAMQAHETATTVEFVKPVTMKTFANEAQSLYFTNNTNDASSERIIGFVRIVLGQESLNREIIAIVIRNATIALIFITASIIIIFLGLKKMTKPLETLTQKVRELGGGNEVTHVPVETMDEIGRLATAFNAMLDERKAGREAFQKILMEIHDGIGGITTNISLLSELARKAASREDAAKALDTISTLSRDGMAEVRSLMFSLDRNDMSWSTFCAEIRNQATRTLAPYAIAFEMVTDIEPGSPEPTSLLCLQLFKVYREALTNVIKHSKARNVRTSLRARHGRIMLLVQDDGQGCDQAALCGNGRGVAHIKRRAAGLGGSATITGDEGTSVCVDIPVSQKSLRS